jgi:hypothetical protein
MKWLGIRVSLCPGSALVLFDRDYERFRSVVIGLVVIALTEPSREVMGAQRSRSSFDRQNGNGLVPLWTVTHFSSVNSWAAAMPPKRPQPLSLTPPNGIWGSS